MISARTKRQLVIFVIITLLGVSFVGARYARLDKLFYDSSFNVNAQFAQSGGIFVGAEVDYRGVRVGQVSDMHITKTGVDVVLAIDNGWKNKIPSTNVIALVANRSAVGEQYVDLEPAVNSGPYLKANSVIPTGNTRTPVSTVTVLNNLDQLVRSVPQGSLRTSVNSLGQSFAGTGPALGKIIDGMSSFIKAATDNFGTTTALIKDAQTVLATQADEGSAIRSFSRDLALFTDTLAGHDASLRRVIASGSATAIELRTFLDQNKVNLGRLINNVLVTGRIGYANIKGLRQILVLYPYMAAGGYTVLAKNANGTTNARFGLILQQTPPVCVNGYHYASQLRQPYNLNPARLDTTAQCTDAPTQSDARGAKQAPRAAASDYRAPVATYAQGKVTWSDQTSAKGGSLDTGKDGLAWLMFASAMQ
ncbi:MAG: MCE family protein [Marmoricola sp.]